MDQQELAEFVWYLREACGYTDICLFADQRRYGAVARKMFTWAVIVGRVGDFTSIEDGWCYHSHADARTALDAWDGSGEPSGWHRHPRSGRRVAADEGERDWNGQPVAKGSAYIRG